MYQKPFYTGKSTFIWPLEEISNVALVEMATFVSLISSIKFHGSRNSLSIFGGIAFTGRKAVLRESISNLANIGWNNKIFSLKT